MRRLAITLLVIIVLATSFLALGGKTQAFTLFGEVCNSANGTSNSEACTGNGGSGNPISGSNGVIAKVTQIIALVSGIAAVIMIIISGIQFAASGGDSQRVATARQTIIYSVIGLIIAAIAQSIVLFVLRQ